MPATTTIGDRVELQKNKIITYGFIRFVGPLKGKTGTFYGIELDEARGSNNGSYGDIRYFRCDDKHGLFVRKSFIARTLIPKHNRQRARVCIGDHVYVPSKHCNGSVEYIGTPYSIDNIYYGVKLERPVGNSDGRVHKQWCFDCKANFAVFVQLDDLQVITKEDYSESDGFEIVYKDDLQTNDTTHLHHNMHYDYTKHLPLPLSSSRSSASSTNTNRNRASNGCNGRPSVSWRDLLVAGYCRVASLYVPRSVVQIVYVYQNWSDEWSDKYSSSDIRLDESKLVMTVCSKEQPTAFGNEVVQSGVFKWTLKILAFRSSKYKVSPFVGVIENNEANLRQYQNSAFWNESGYQYCGGNGLLCGLDNYSATHHYRWNKVGDILEIVLDLDERNIRFMINGKDYGVAFKNIKQTAYRLALGVSSCNESQFLLL